MRQNAHSAGFFGDLVEDRDAKVLRRRYGVERVDPGRRPLHTRRARASAKRLYGKAGDICSLNK